jgi:Single-strand binding protein family
MTRAPSTGRPVARFSVAVNSRRRLESGEWADGETTFFPVTVWADQAENATQSLTKGSRVVVLGNSGAQSRRRAGEVAVYPDGLLGGGEGFGAPGWPHLDSDCHASLPTRGQLAHILSRWGRFQPAESSYRRWHWAKRIRSSVVRLTFRR